MARLKKLLLLANQHITRFQKDLAAKDEQLRVLTACYSRPGSATEHQPGLLARTRQAPGCATRIRGEPPSCSGPDWKWAGAKLQHQILWRSQPGAAAAGSLHVGGEVVRLE